MNGSIPEEIQRGYRLLNEGKEEEALRLMIEFEKRDDLTTEERLRCQILDNRKKFRFMHYLNIFEIWDAYHIFVSLKKKEIKN